MRALFVVAVLGVAVGGIRTAPADEPKKPEEPTAKAVSYKTDVAPLLKNACADCHSGAKRKAGLDVTSYDSLMKFVKAGAPEQSKLHKAMLGKGAKLMPPKNPLPKDDVEVIRAWIAAGAKKD
jgi:hypothetical protein